MPPLPAYLLTRHWRDRSQGIELVFWAASPQGPLRLVFTAQQAVCFIARDSLIEGNFQQRKTLKMHGLDGKAVDALYFDQQKNLQQFRKTALFHGVSLYESDIKPHDRFLMERFIKSSLEVIGKGIQKEGYIEFRDPSIRAAEYHPELSYLSLDIETDGINGEIISIALTQAKSKTVIMQGDAKDWSSSSDIDWQTDEKSLLIRFFERIKQLDPDLIIGWNLINFDIDYLEKRSKALRLNFALGRGKEQATVLQPHQAGKIKIASIPGRVALDGIDNLKAAFWHFDSFALSHVAKSLLGRDKLIEANGIDKVAEIQRQFREERPTLAAYNIEDCVLVEDIFQHTELFNFIRQRSAMTGLPMGRQGGSVAAFDNLYLPRLHRAGVVAHDIGGMSYHQSSPGGYVMDSIPGLYDNVLVLDFKSLYPSIIRTFLIDPLGLAQPGEKPVPGFLDAKFSRNKYLLPQIITELWQAREAAKKACDQPLSHAVKIIMNSFYGVLGSEGCRFYNPKLASSITRRGHEIIKLSRERIQEEGFKVIYGDTDSVFVLLGPEYSESKAQKTGRELAKMLNTWWTEHIARQFDLASHLEIEFETHFIRFVMPTIRGSESGSKKRYAGSIRDKAGEMKMVFKGLESVRSDWTPLAQNFQRELYDRIFFNKPWKAYLKETVAMLNKGLLDDQLVYRKRLRQPLEAYIRNQPPHVKAARKLNKQVRWVDYLITLNGPEPIEKQQSPIDYQHYIDKQLQPVADGLLHFIGENFEQLTANQMDLF